MSGLLPRTLFVRPTNMMITHPLQVLSIARELAKRSGNKLTRFRCMREPDQQRLLNFGSFTFKDSETANDIVNQASAITVPLNDRAASNYDILVLAAEKRQDQDIGLIEVASMVGLPLNISGRQVIRQKIEAETDHDASDSESKYVLAPISEPSKNVSFWAQVKCERRQAPMENFKSGRGLFQNRHNFDGDLMSWRAGDQSTNRPMSRLESAWEKFGGFSNRYHRKSANAEQQQTESKENDI